MFDESDSDCPMCGGNAAFGDCSCDGGDLMRCGVERFVEFAESGRARVSELDATPAGATRGPARRETKSTRPSNEAVWVP